MRRAKLLASRAQLSAQSARNLIRGAIAITRAGIADEFDEIAAALLLLLLPAIAQAADITGVPKIREGDQLQIGNHRIRLGGIDAPAVDQLCLNTKRRALDLRRRRARRTDQALRRQELDLSDQGRHRPPRPHRGALRGRRRGHPEMAGVERLGAGACTRFSRDYEADEKAAREAKAGMWQGAFIAPWDWRVRNKKTAILGAVKPPENAKAILLASASGPVAPSPDCTIKGNVNRSGECIYHQPTSRWYAKIEMKISKGTRWFCSVDEAEAAGCRETGDSFSSTSPRERGEARIERQCRKIQPINDRDCRRSAAGCGARRCSRSSSSSAMACSLIWCCRLLDALRAPARARRHADGDADRAGHSRRSHECRAGRRPRRRGLRDARGRLVSGRSDHAEILDRDRRQRAARPALQGRAGQQSLLSRPPRGSRL